jgi:hypothetical protein
MHGTTVKKVLFPRFNCPKHYLRGGVISRSVNFFFFQIWNCKAYYLSRTYDSEFYSNIVNFVCSCTVHELKIISLKTVQADPRGRAV